MTVFDEAIQFAVQAHSGMHRKHDPAPYIVHPLEAAAICATLTADLEVLAAAVLHDTVEDAGVAPEELEARFGPRVAALVAAETELKRAELPPEQTWRIRKEESLEVLRNAKDPGVKILWLGDKLANVRSFYRARLVSGDRVWESFHQKDPAQQAWYYRSIVTLLEDLRDTAAWQEFSYVVSKLFEGVNRDGTQS